MEKKLGDILRDTTSYLPEIISSQEDKQQSPIKKRLAESAIEMITDPAKIEDAMFHHSILCQTYLPYKNPGDDITLCRRSGRG